MPLWHADTAPVWRNRVAQWHRAQPVSRRGWTGRDGTDARKLHMRRYKYHRTISHAVQLLRVPICANGGLPRGTDSKHTDGQRLGPDFEVSGEFTSSHAVLNAIQRSIVASAEANWANDVPTDCPHRERRGYLGDGQHAMGTVVSNFWAVRGYVKWLRDYRDQQQLVRYCNRSFQS